MTGLVRAWRARFGARSRRLRAPDRETAELRREWERLLHDGPALRVSALALELGLLDVNLTDPAGRRQLDAAQDTVRGVLDDLRTLGEALYPPVLTGAGMEAALRSVAERRDIALTVDARGLAGRDHRRAALLVADHLRSLCPRTAVSVRLRGGRRLVRVSVTAHGDVPSRRWAVVRCG
ncbi:histidine kinase [Actinokineospora sp. 24-640]